MAAGDVTVDDFIGLRQCQFAGCRTVMPNLTGRLLQAVPAGSHMEQAIDVLDPGLQHTDLSY
jgi:hypothetical protein